jgi:UDP-N-acetyl-D-glucosamine dehydrogenase
MSSTTARADLAIIGLGYVGMPLARAASRKGLQVIGLDLNAQLVDAVAAGRSHIDDLSDDDVAAMLAAGFRATTDPGELAGADAVVICVPTPLGADGAPDLGAVLSATAMVSAVIRPGMLVVLESTTYPGTTEELLRPALEASGLVVGTDIHLAFSPERVDPGNANWDSQNTPKVVGGCTPACTRAAAALYEQFVDTVVPVSGTREAEMAKLLENTYRHVNIALVNEMARFCHELDIDLWEVIDAAATKPFGFQAFRPGPGVGGHCIPIDPNYLSYSVRTRLGYAFRFVELAEEINSMMPTYVVQRVQSALNEDARALRGSKVLLLGVTYKPDIADVRESPAFAVARALRAQGAEVSYHDPLVPTWSLDEHTLTSAPDLEVALRDAHIVVLLQDHREYDLDDIVRLAPRLFDTRGVALAGATVERL